VAPNRIYRIVEGEAKLEAIPLLRLRAFASTRELLALARI
jgi:hypothetical protein